MSFLDDVKRSLGFEEKRYDEGSLASDYRQGYYDDDDIIISPEHSLYKIMLMRPKTLDDVNYIVDQLLNENNPIILDLSFLEKESPANFKLAGDKIKELRENYGAAALLLSQCEDKNLIIIAPSNIDLVKVG
ncbi:cell division protein SepF [Methanobrevibacter woesei]|uniref:cell division protein SepF n=1 Tax=Methanobrevibacter woesei TaxID=190976 RepID=UPI002352735E|nr:cell division protein SepF [Methanobrevibacter woesei]